MARGGQQNTGGGTFTLNSTVASAATPEIQVRNGALATNPLLSDGQVAAVAFGNTAMGSGITRTFRVENTATATLTLSGITFSGGAFTVASSNLVPPVSIPCAGSATFTVTLTPSTTGPDSLMMHLASDDVDESIFDVPLSISGIPANPEIVLHDGFLDIDPELVDGQAGAVVFASTLASSGVTRTFLVRNTGTTVLQVSGVTFSNTAGVTATSSVAAPFNVAAGASVSFDVTLTPAAAGTFSPIMHIGSTDANENPFDVPLSITANASTSEIVMHDGNSISFPQIADGQVTPVDFGATTASVGITHTFLVKNAGTTSLTLSSVTFSGGSGTTATTSFTTARNVAANATTTFTVTLSRAALGSDSVQMQIANNDADENPFDVPLTFTVVSQLPGETPTGPVLLTDGGSISGTTQNYVNNLNMTDGCTGFTTPGRDRFYQITLAAGQQITAALQPTAASFDPAIYLIRASEAGLAAPTCLNGDDSGSTSAINTAIYRNTGAVPEGVVICVDSFSNSTAHQGTFLLEIILDPPNAAAEIVVEQPSGTGLTDPSSTVVFDAAPVGVAGAKVFTVRNTGSGDLTGLVISKDGLQSGDYAVSLPGASTLATSASTTFTVTFTPGAPGTRLAVIHIASNDADENPFDINLSGIGLTPIESWRQIFFGSPANFGNGANTADPDGDGSNLKEFAFGTNPTVPDAGIITVSGAVITQRGLPTTSVTNVANGVDFRAMFGRRLDHVAAGVTYTVQFSADLITWQDNTTAPTVVASDAEIEAVMVPYPFFLNDGRKARFFRVNITIAP